MDIATDGKGAIGWCHGFKLHLACNDRGGGIAFVLTGANVSDRDSKAFDVLAQRLYGKLFADNIETINEEYGPNSTLATQVCHHIMNLISALGAY